MRRRQPGSRSVLPGARLGTSGDEREPSSSAPKGFAPPVTQENWHGEHAAGEAHCAGPAAISEPPGWDPPARWACHTAIA